MASSREIPRRGMASLQRAGCQWDKGHAARMRGVLACRTLLQCRRLRKCAAKDNVFYKNSKTTFTAEMRHQNVTYKRYREFALGIAAFCSCGEMKFLTSMGCTMLLPLCTSVAPAPCHFCLFTLSAMQIFSRTFLPAHACQH